MSDLRLSWLGHPRIWRDDVPVRLETRKTTALLAFLSLADRPVSRERLASIFWPEFDRERAPANLRRSIASLHASLPGDWLAAERLLIEVLVLLADACLGRCVEEEAWRALEEALRRARPAGYLQTFLEAGPGVVGLLRRGLGAGRWEDAELAVRRFP